MRTPIQSNDDERILAAKQSVDDLLDLWAPPAVSADFDRRLYTRIEQRARWWDFLFRPQRLVPVAAAAALVIGAGLWVGSPGVPPAVTVPRSAAVDVLPADQAENALQEMQMMQEFNRLVRSEPSAEPKM